MTDEITLTSPSLADFLDRLGLPASARDRVIAIDQELARELETDNPDANGCASLVLEAADLIAHGGPLGFDWSRWDDENEPGDFDGFDIDLIDWKVGGDSDWGEGDVG